MLDIEQSVPEGDIFSVFSIEDPLELTRTKEWLEDRIRVGRHSFIHEVVELTPTLALLLLERNPSNRKLKPNEIAKYVADIRDGCWDLNGETLKVSKDGLLNDGQNRCQAVIESGLSIMTLIVFGCSRESRLTVDRNAVRTGGDYLSMSNVPNANVASAVATLLWEYNHFQRVGTVAARRISKTQIQRVFHENAQISESIIACNFKNSGMITTLSALSFCHFLFARHDPDAATAFIRKLVVGDGLNTKDPIHRAREKMYGKKVHPRDAIDYVIQTWNMVRKGRKASALFISEAELPLVRD